MAILTGEPWNLELQDKIFANIIAVNHYGGADASPDGGGARIVLVPDPPTDLQNLSQVTSRTMISFTFADGDSDGGLPIQDYRLWYDQSTDNWIVLVEQLAL